MAEPLGVPQVRGSESAGFVPPRNAMSNEVNGTSGAPEKSAVAMPVPASTSTVPTSLTPAPGKFVARAKAKSRAR